MSEIKFGTAVTLKQAADIILATPQNRYLLQGEPGIGKSSLLKTLGKALPGHEVAYIDVPNMDLGDIAMPVIDRDTRTTTYYPNSRFKIHLGKPVITMLDEFTKGAEPIKNMLHPLLEVANPRLGDISVHPESIVFLTGNLSSDGVGDNLKAHSRNRIIPLTVQKPTSDEWLGWAVNNDIDPVVMAWVKQYPHAMASYTDSAQADNPYIYNPKKMQLAFVSPRSLERASNIVRARAAMDQDSLIAALSGAIGEAASRDLQAYIAYQDQLPTWESIVKTPRTASVPDSAGACAVLVFGAIAKIDKSTMTAFMEYIERFEPEWQACFAINVAKNPAKQSIAFSSKAFGDWVAKNEDIL
jgi:energy-coupling factor transporter ATP-binding protein EcfA2